MAKINKAYTLVSVIHSMSIDKAMGEPRLVALLVQISKAMGVFAAKVGAKQIRDVARRGDIILDATYSKGMPTLYPGELPVAIEMILNLLPKKEMNSFLLNANYSTKAHVREEIKSSLLCMIMDFDRKINEEFHTTATTSRDLIGNIMTKPLITQKAKKLKSSTRKVSEKEKKHLLAVEEFKKEKERKMKVLRKHIAESKKKKENSMLVE
jgi:hypothetical protein